ncbi:MAG: ASCH domain-containing protein [Bacteroidales bacterium]|nr:ASCH domain-containing protein [Bacteroidales bacterium]
MRNKRAKKQKYLFIAVKPEYAYKLISGEKDIELRKTKPNVRQGDYVIIYASAPEKAIIGFGIIKGLILCSPKEMWVSYSDRLGIDEQRFLSYYENSNKSVGIELEKIKAINPIGLEELRSFAPNFHPPQIYRYITNEVVHRVLAKSEC